MPIIHINMLEGRSSDVKRELIQQVTEAVSRTLGNSLESIRVLLYEVPEENWGVGGNPIIDRKKNKS